MPAVVLRYMEKTNPHLFSVNFLVWKAEGRLTPVPYDSTGGVAVVVFKILGSHKTL